jgi:hypothetical protein
VVVRPEAFVTLLSPTTRATFEPYDVRALLMSRIDRGAFDVIENRADVFDPATRAHIETARN